MVTASLPETDDYAPSPHVSRSVKRKLIPDEGDVLSQNAYNVNTVTTEPDNNVIITHNPNTRMFNPMRISKRYSPFHNTPKQRREERRKLIRVSAAKIRDIDDPELFLRRSVLVNNTYRRLREEMFEERRVGVGYGTVGFSSSNPFEGPPLIAGVPSVLGSGPPPKRICLESNDLNTNYLPYMYGMPEEVEQEDSDITDDELTKTVSDMSDSNDASDEASSSSSDDDVDVASYHAQVPLVVPNLHQAMQEQEQGHVMDGTSEQQLLYEMDIMFNNLYSVISGSVSPTS